MLGLNLDFLVGSGVTSTSFTGSGLCGGLPTIAYVFDAGRLTVGNVFDGGGTAMAAYTV